MFIKEETVELRQIIRGTVDRLSELKFLRHLKNQWFHRPHISWCNSRIHHARNVYFIHTREVSNSLLIPRWTSESNPGSNIYATVQIHVAEVIAFPSWSSSVSLSPKLWNESIHSSYDTTDHTHHANWLWKLMIVTYSGFSVFQTKFADHEHVCKISPESPIWNFDFIRSAILEESLFETFKTINPRCSSKTFGFGERKCWIRFQLNTTLKRQLLSKTSALALWFLSDVLPTNRHLIYRANCNPLSISYLFISLLKSSAYRTIRIFKIKWWTFSIIWLTWAISWKFL